MNQPRKEKICGVKTTLDHGARPVSAAGRTLKKGSYRFCRLGALVFHLGHRKSYNGRYFEKRIIDPDSRLSRENKELPHADGWKNGSKNKKNNGALRSGPPRQLPPFAPASYSLRGSPGFVAVSPFDILTTKLVR